MPTREISTTAVAEEVMSWSVTRPNPCPGGCDRDCLELHTPLRNYLNNALVSLLDDEGTRSAANMFIHSYSDWRRAPDTYHREIISHPDGSLTYRMNRSKFVTDSGIYSGIRWLEVLPEITDAYPELLQLMNLKVAVSSVTTTTTTYVGEVGYDQIRVRRLKVYG